MPKQDFQKSRCFSKKRLRKMKNANIFCMRLLIISLLICIYTNKLIGQSDYEGQMLSLEKKIFLETNDSIVNNYCLEKFYLSIPHSDFERSFIELKRVNDDLIQDSTCKVNFFWNACLVSKLKGDIVYANIFYDLYLSFTNDSSQSSLLLGLIIKEEIGESILDEFSEKINSDSTFDCFDCFKEVKAYKLKRKRIYIISSMIVPGLGTLFAGDALNGFGSVLTVGGSGLGVYYLIKNNLHWGTGIWGYLLFVRFYKGNIQLTKENVLKLEDKKRNKLALKCYTEVQKVLNKYPIDFRLNK